MVYFMGAFDSCMIAGGVVSIIHAKLSGCHRTPNQFQNLKLLSFNVASARPGIMHCW